MSAETDGQQTKPSSAFDPDNFGPVMLIMMMRLYDLGLAFLSVIDKQGADELVELHSQGHTFSPRPAFIEGYEDEEVEV